MSKGKQLAYSSRTVQCPHTALHSNGGMGPNLHKKPQWVLWQRKKERKKHNVDLAASRQTALSLSPLGMLGPQWGLTGWKSILCETPQWLRGLENVETTATFWLSRPSPLKHCVEQIHDWESLAGTAVPSSTLHGIHNCSAGHSPVNSQLKMPSPLISPSCLAFLPALSTG